MRAHAKYDGCAGLVHLLMLIGMEIGLLDALYRLESLPFLRTPGADPPAWRLWLASTPPQDAVAALLRLAATAAAWWLLATTGLYLVARVVRVAPSWRELIQDNHSSLRSGNPDLIFPGETVVLPPTT